MLIFMQRTSSQACTLFMYAFVLCCVMYVIQGCHKFGFCPNIRISEVLNFYSDGFDCYSDFRVSSKR